MEFTKSEIDKNRQIIRTKLIENVTLDELPNTKISTVLDMLQKWQESHSSDNIIDIDESNISLYDRVYESDEEVVSRLVATRERHRTHDIKLLKQLMAKYPEIVVDRT